MRRPLNSSTPTPLTTSKVSAGFGASDIHIGADSVVGGDWAKRIKDAWKSVVDATSYVGDKEEIKSNRIQRRVYELLSKVASSNPKHAGLNERELYFVFFCKPNSFQESKRAWHVSDVHFERTVRQEIDICSAND
ncbi:hypothetical protein JHK85_010381 [Glycine max]|nr:hypothetical protein JHK85_010381 [Glycine max]